MSADAKPKAKPRGLGRGLNALFEDEETNFVTPAAAKNPEENKAASSSVATAPRTRLTAGIEQLVRNETQPRQMFDEDAIDRLATSLKEHGMIQPIVVRKKGEGKYEIIAGERRWRAAQKAQLHEVPISIVEMEDKQVLEVALIENLQREDLNPVEEALGYQRLMDEHGMTQEEIAKSIGKSRPHIANTVRLLNLPPQVLKYLETGELSAGHARALISVNNAEELAKEIIARKLNVRGAEELVNASPAGGKRSLGKKGSYTKNTDTLALERDLSNVLGMKVVIDSKDEKSGTLKIDFKSLNQLDDLILRLSKIPKVMMGD
jgi:ParB family transcriptional regulator, chromosome partitioning protein